MHVLCYLMKLKPSVGVAITATGFLSSFKSFSTGLTQTTTLTSFDLSITTYSNTKHKMFKTMALIANSHCHFDRN